MHFLQEITLLVSKGSQPIFATIGPTMCTSRDRDLCWNSLLNYPVFQSEAIAFAVRCVRVRVGVVLSVHHLCLHRL
jgi:hypothetical protein